MFILSIVVLTKAIKFYKISYPINTFTWVIILSVFDNILYLITVIILKNFNLFYKITSFTQSFYQYIEYIIICLFLIKIAGNHIFSVITKFFLLVISTSFILLGLQGQNIFEKHFLLLTIFELIIVNLCSCIIFIGEINGSNIEKHKSSVILTKGIFIFINFTTPYYIISNYLGNNLNEITNSLNFINDMGYVIFFISLYKSLKCYQNK